MFFLDEATYKNVLEPINPPTDSTEEIKDLVKLSEDRVEINTEILKKLDLFEKYQEET